jgi:hypothetical protein
VSTRESLRSVVASLEWEGDVAVQLSPQIRMRAKKALGEGALRWIAGIVERTVEELLSDKDADLLAPWQELRTYGQTTLVDLLYELTSIDTDAPSEPRVDEAHFDDIVIRAVPLERMLHTGTTLFRHCVSGLVSHAFAVDAGADVVEVIVADGAKFSDRWSQLYAQRYLAERWRMIDSHHARARAAIESLVSGQPIDAETQRWLGVPLDDWHIGCVIGALPGAALDNRLVDRFAASFARAIRMDTTTRYESANGVVWLWCTGSRRPDIPAADSLGTPASLVVGYGRPHMGSKGFRRTHLEAGDAHRIAQAHGEARTVSFTDVALVATLSNDAERAAWFVADELGELNGSESDLTELRDTLQAFYAARMRVAPTAEQLFVHRNTLISRLTRIERLLGHSVAERTAETQAALLLRKYVLFGDSQD